MKYIWSYLIVAFCGAVTSARNMDFPGNRNGFQDNLVSAIKDEKVWTPPTSSGLIIDSNGYPGNSNEKDTENLSVEDMPNVLNQVLSSLFNQSKLTNEYEVVPFSKEDITNMENSAMCKMMCASGVEKPPCKCE